MFFGNDRVYHDKKTKCNINKLKTYTQKKYSKQFGFQDNYSTDHVIPQLADQIHELFRNENKTLGLSIDLCKIFDSIGYAILFKKLENCGNKGTNLA